MKDVPFSFVSPYVLGISTIFIHSFCNAVKIKTTLVYFRVWFFLFYIKLLFVNKIYAINCSKSPFVYSVLLYPPFGYTIFFLYRNKKDRKKEYKRRIFVNCTFSNIDLIISVLHLHHWKIKKKKKIFFRCNSNKTYRTFRKNAVFLRQMENKHVTTTMKDRAKLKKGRRKKEKKIL